VNSAAQDYDVVIVGGALSGAATALMLKRERPALRILVVEKSSVFSRRVGEATIEISAWFLSRVLGLTQYLNEHHLMKQGMRFWFMDGRNQSLDRCSEIGGRYLARVPAYQVDRAHLDEEVLRCAVAAGVELLRPAGVQKIELNPGGRQRIHLQREGEPHQLTARWVVDASGFAALLSRQERLLRPNLHHPTTAVWSRWTGVKDMDGRELAARYPEWAMSCHGIRGTATNHFVGDGWWAWSIPLKGGDTSIGIVFDQRLVKFPSEGSLGQRLKSFLDQHPVARELMEQAQWREGDVHWRKNLAYSSAQYAGDGYVLVGDAGAFLDPFYSPGMDWVAFTSYSAKELILAQQRGEDPVPLVRQLNDTFRRSYQRWFPAIYRDKYHYMGDFEFMRLAFLLDLGLYYLGVVNQPFLRGEVALKEPLFSTGPSTPFYHLMKGYNRRFAQMARRRRERGVFGVRNTGERFLFGGYTFSPISGRHVLLALCQWGCLELTEGWRTWFRRDTEPVPEPQPLNVPVENSV